MGADVAASRRAEQSVHHRVGDDIGVGVTLEPAVVGNLDAAEDQRAVGAEAVAVIADADAHSDGPIGSSRRRRLSKTQISVTPRSLRNSIARS